MLSMRGYLRASHSCHAQIGRAAGSLSLRLKQNPAPLRGPWGFCLRSAPSFLAVRFSALPLSCHAAKRPGRSVAFASAQAKPSPSSWALGFRLRSAPSFLAVRFSALLLKRRSEARASLLSNPTLLGYFTTVYSGLQGPGKNFSGKFRVPLRGPWAFLLAPLHPRCSPQLRASRYIFSGALTPSRPSPLASTSRTLSASLSRAA